MTTTRTLATFEGIPVEIIREQAWMSKVRRLDGEGWLVCWVRADKAVTTDTRFVGTHTLEDVRTETIKES